MCGKWIGCFFMCKLLLIFFKNGFIWCKWVGIGGFVLVFGGNVKLFGFGLVFKDGGFCLMYFVGVLLKKKCGFILFVGLDYFCFLFLDWFIVGLLISVEFFIVILFVLLLMVVIGLNGLFVVV